MANISQLKSYAILKTFFTMAIKYFVKIETLTWSHVDVFALKLLLLYTFFIVFENEVRLEEIHTAIRISILFAKSTLQYLYNDYV